MERGYTQWKQELCLKMCGIYQQQILLPLQKTRMMTQKIEFFVLFFFQYRGSIESFKCTSIPLECQYASMYICDKVKAIQQCPSTPYTGITLFRSPMLSHLDLKNIRDSVSTQKAVKGYTNVNVSKNTSDLEYLFGYYITSELILRKENLESSLH